MLEFTCEYYEFIHVWAVLWRFDTAAAFGWRQQLWKKRSKTAMLFHPRFQHYDQFARFFKKEKNTKRSNSCLSFWIRYRQYCIEMIAHSPISFFCNFQRAPKDSFYIYTYACVWTMSNCCSVLDQQMSVVALSNVFLNTASQPASLKLPHPSRVLAGSRWHEEEEWGEPAWAII